MGNGHDKHTHQKNVDLTSKQSKQPGNLIDPDLDKLFKVSISLKIIEVLERILICVYLFSLKISIKTTWNCQFCRYSELKYILIKYLIANQHEKIKEYFWNCQLISKILIKNCQANHDQGSGSLIDTQKAQLILNHLINASDNNTIIDTYLNLIFLENEISDSSKFFSKID
jgi:hypothetical protein